MAKTTPNFPLCAKQLHLQPSAVHGRGPAVIPTGTRRKRHPSGVVDRGEMRVAMASRGFRKLPGIEGMPWRAAEAEVTRAPLIIDDY